MGKVSEKIKEEFLAMIPPTIFFFFTLGLVAVVRMLMTKGNGDPHQHADTSGGRRLAPRQGGVDCRHAADHQPLP